MATVLIGTVIITTLWVVFLWALIDASRRPAEAFGGTAFTKNTTIILILLTGGLGALYYLLRIRPIVSEP